MVQVYRLNNSGRGKFLLPSGLGGRRCGYGKPTKPSMCGTGLLLSKDLGGFGVSQTEKQVGYVSPPTIPTSFQHKLQGLNIRGSGVKKMKTISLRF